ncbi:MAG: P-loop NTPase [Oscillospiraceae bacterium]
MAQVIMIASGKGGTGKSTFATYIATELALLNKKVLLTELDMGLRSIDIISGTSQLSIYDISDVLMEKCTAQKAMITSPYTDKLSIIPAPYTNNEINFDRLKVVVDELYGDFDYIILDTAAGIGKAFRAAAKVSNTGIIVATADAVSVRDARIVSDELFAKGIKDIRLVINKFSKQTFKYSGFNDLDAVIDQTQAQLLGLIPQSQEIMVSAMNGTLLSSSCNEKHIYTAIAERLTGKQRQIILQ